MSVNKLDLSDLAGRGIIAAPNVAFRGTVTLEPPLRLYGNVVVSDSRIGAYSYVSPHSTVYSATVGRFVSIGNDVVVGPSRHPTDWLSSSPAFYEDFLRGEVFDAPPFEKLVPLTLGSDIWVGAHAAIMGGITIGHGAIIGYGAVVTKNVEPFAVVGGVPARTIRSRFSGALVEKLLAFAWWNDDVVAARKAGLVVDWTKPEHALEILQGAREDGRLKPFDPGTAIRIRQASVS